MSAINYSFIYDGKYATLSAQVKGTSIPLVLSAEKLQVENIYHNIQTGTYKNVRELCEDIQNTFSTRATLLVRVTLLATAHLSAKT